MTNLLEGLKSLWASRRSAVFARWNRTLPFGDYVVDRWEKAQALGFAEGVSIYDTAHVFGDVTVGKNTWIGPFVILDGTGGLQIGSNCSISAGVQIYTHDSVRWANSAGLEPNERAPTVIGDNCYIGPNTVIGKGISIGNRCVVGANSLVLQDIPSGSKAFGSPCRIVGRTITT